MPGVGSPIKGNPEAAGGVGQAIAEPCQLSVICSLIQVVIEQLHKKPSQDCGLWRSIGLQGPIEIASETMHPHMENLGMHNESADLQCQGSCKVA